MGRYSSADRDTLCAWVPVVHDPGGFLAQRCCLCGTRLVPGHAVYFEGPVCCTCDMVIQRKTFFRPDADTRAEGGLS